jgi:hypothetical protein
MAKGAVPAAPVETLEISLSKRLPVAVGTPAIHRGCFIKVRASVSAGVCGGFRALRGVVVLAAVKRVGPTGRSWAPSGPCGRYLVAVELQQVVGGGD